MSARRPLTRVLLLHSAQLGGHLAPTSSVGHCPRWVPHPRGWLETCAAKRHLPKVLVKVLEHAVDPCRRSRMVAMRKRRECRRLFHWDDFCALLLIRVNAPNRPRAGGYPPYTLLLLAALLLALLWQIKGAACAVGLNEAAGAAVEGRSQ